MSDVIVIGAGAAGGIVACVLAEAGKSVLVLERGRMLGDECIRRDHLRNHRLSLYGHNTGPDLNGHPRVFVDTKQRRHVVRPHEGGYHNNAMCVGGGTRVYGGQAWRFLPTDFRMAETYGVPAGSSLADWPIGYDDLEPYYERAEWEIGVAGDGRVLSRYAPRRRDYPMPPVPMNPSGQALQRGAEALGWDTNPVPLLTNTIERDNRPACIQCGSCVGFGCPSDSRNGTHNTVLPRALATGRCRLVSGAIVERIDTDHAGRVVGVSYFTDDDDGQPVRNVARAKAVIVSSGAIESARLLLNSASAREPNGLGNTFDQVGRHLQGHYYPGACGLFDEVMYDGRGPGVSISTLRFTHNNPGIVGGGMLANDFLVLPVHFWRAAWPPDLPRWGLAAKRFMREGYTRVIDVKGPVQEISSPTARVTIDPDVRDRYGIPVVRLSGTTHPETVRTADAMRQRAIEWLRAAGAKTVWSGADTIRLSAGQHQAGTCRMGHDERTSVTDGFGRVHRHDNLFVLDGSVHVTNGPLNPVLTIMALAYRGAEHVARSI